MPKGIAGPPSLRRVATRLAPTEVEAAPRCRQLHQAGHPQQHREEPRCHHRGAADAGRQARGARYVQRGETVRTNPGNPRDLQHYR